MTRTTGLLILMAGLLVPGGQASLLAQQTEATLTSMYTGPDGLTYFKEVPLTYSQSIEIIGGMKITRAAPKPAPREPIPYFVAPYRRYAITLSGRGEIVGSGGQRFICDRDHMLLVEDLTGRGHNTRAIGPEDWVVMYVEIDEPRPRAPR